MDFSWLPGLSLLLWRALKGRLSHGMQGQCVYLLAGELSNEFNLSVQRTEIALIFANSVFSEIGSSAQNSVEMICSNSWHLGGISNSESYTVD